MGWPLSQEAALILSLFFLSTSSVLQEPRRQRQSLSVLASASGGLGCGQAGGCWV